MSQDDRENGMRSETQSETRTERKLPDQISLAQFCDEMEAEAKRAGSAVYADDALRQGVTSAALRSRMQRESEGGLICAKT